jgi:hypothetical protein
MQLKYKMEHIFLLVVLIIVCTLLSVAKRSEVENFENTSPYSMDSYSEQRTKTLEYFRYLAPFFINDITILDGANANETNSNKMKSLLFFPTVYDVYCTKINNTANQNEENSRCMNNYIQNIAAPDDSNEDCGTINTSIGAKNDLNSSKIRILNNVYQLKKVCTVLMIEELSYKQGSTDEYILKLTNIPMLTNMMVLQFPQMISFQHHGLYEILNRENTMTYSYTNYEKQPLILHLRKINNEYLYPSYSDDVNITSILAQTMVTLYYMHYVESILSSVPLTNDFKSINNAIYTYNNIHISYNKKTLLNDNNPLSDLINIDTANTNSTKLCRNINISFNKSPTTPNDSVFSVSLVPNNSNASQVKLNVHPSFTKLISSLDTSINNVEVLVKISVVYSMDVLTIYAFYRNIQKKENFVFMTRMHGTNVVLQYKDSDISSQLTTFKGSYDKHIPNMQYIAKLA